MNTRNIHYFQQQEHEDNGSIQAWAERRQYNLRVTNFFKGEKNPDQMDTDLLIILGGSMNVYEDKKYPWLKEEKRCISRAIGKGTRVLGICLGAQLAADALGAGIRKNEHTEIGWHKVHLIESVSNHPVFQDIPGEFLCMHWHEDTFDIPGGAVRIAESKACRNQGFLWKQQVLGLQFHLEFTPDTLNRIIHANTELEKAPFVQSALEIHCVSLQQYNKCNQMLEKIMDRFLEL